jgi:hypothetical protein
MAGRARAGKHVTPFLHVTFAEFYDMRGLVLAVGDRGRVCIAARIEPDTLRRGRARTQRERRAERAPEPPTAGPANDDSPEAEGAR